LDPALRISHWFQDGHFFEDGQDGENSHDVFICDLHLGRLQRMFEIVGFKIENTTPRIHWIPDAVTHLRDGKNNGPVRQYFGTATTKHFLFEWMCDRLMEIDQLKSTCLESECCPNEGNSNCPRHTGPFMALKSVFCKTRANKGEQVRFSIQRLFHILDAARRVGTTISTTIYPKDIDELEGIEYLYLPVQFQAKFWSLKDPTILLGEFVHWLAKMKILESVSLISAMDISNAACLVAEIKLKVFLKKQMGGNESDRLKVIAEDLVKCGVPKFQFEGTDLFSIKFAISPEEI